MRRALVFLAFLSLAAPGHAEPVFQGLGFIPNANSSQAYAVSADGSVVVGASGPQVSVPGVFVPRPFRWKDGVMEKLGPGAGGHGFAFDVSGNGSVVVGELGSEAFRWEAGALAALGDLPGGGFYSSARGVSRDGRVVVGHGATAYADQEAFRWEAGVMEALGFLNAYDDYSIAHAVSSNGVIVGEARGFYQGYAYVDAFRFDAGVMEEISGPNVDPGPASDVNPDGSAIVGLGFRWIDGTIESIFFPHSSSQAFGVSDDGSIAVGGTFASSGSSPQAVIWGASRIGRALQDVLEDDYGLDLGGWNLREARGISADGRTIVGSGINPSGQYEAWIVRLGPVCDDHADNDADGLADLADPGCPHVFGKTESPACDDGVDNDHDGKIDWDGTRHLPPDPVCVNNPWLNREYPVICGLGFEIGLVLPLLALVRRRRRAPR
jgi:probable HAF family extracellular repeat protein